MQNSELNKRLDKVIESISSSADPKHQEEFNRIMEEEFAKDLNGFGMHIYQDERYLMAMLQYGDEDTITSFVKYKIAMPETLVNPDMEELIDAMTIPSGKDPSYTSIMISELVYNANAEGFTDIKPIREYIQKVCKSNADADIKNACVMSYAQGISYIPGLIDQCNMEDVEIMLAHITVKEYLKEGFPFFAISILAKEQGSNMYNLDKMQQLLEHDFSASKYTIKPEYIDAIKAFAAKVLVMQPFREYLKARDAEALDNKLFDKKNANNLPEEKDRAAVKDFIYRMSLMGKHAEAKPLTLDEFKSEFANLPEPKINALYHQVNYPGNNDVSSILSSLLRNPTDANLEIFNYLLEQYPKIKFHKAIDIRSSHFDTQYYQNDDALRLNAQKMLAAINQKASQEDKNKMGLVSLAIYFDDVSLFKDLVDNPSTRFDVKCARNLGMFDSIFMHQNREELREYFLSKPELVSKVSSFDEMIIYQALVSCSVDEVTKTVAALKAHPSFQANIVKAFSLSFMAISGALDAQDASKGSLEQAVENYKQIMMQANNQLDFSYQFRSMHILENILYSKSSLAAKNKHKGISEDDINDAILSSLGLMLMYQPQLIASLPDIPGYLSADNRAGLFFNLVMQESDQTFLDKIFKNNTHVAKYLDEFFKLNLEAQVKILLAAGVDAPEKLAKVMGNFSNPKYQEKIKVLENKINWLSIASNVNFEAMDSMKQEFRKQMFSFLSLGILEQYDLLKKVGIEKLDTMVKNIEAMVGADSKLLANFKKVAMVVRNHANGVDVAKGLDINGAMLIIRDARMPDATEEQKALMTNAFLANPQLIKEFFDDRLKQGQEYSMFFREVRQMRDVERLKSLSNENTKAFVEEFLKKDLAEQKQILEASGVRDKSDVEWLIDNLQYIGAGLGTNSYNVNITADLNTLMPKIEDDLPKDYENRGIFYKIYEWWNNLTPARHESPTINGSLLVESQALTTYIEERSQNIAKARTAEIDAPKANPPVLEVTWVGRLDRQAEQQEGQQELQR